MTNVLITGANGFIGKALCLELLSRDIDVVAVVRSLSTTGLPDAVRQVVVADINAGTDWTEVLPGIDIVIHLAARVHVMQDTAADPLAEFRKVNVAGTANLAAQASRVGVKRFIFISSVKVNGEQTSPGKPYTAEDEAAPADAYGVSKYEAEQALLGLANAASMSVVIIRPPLVYGPGVKANFQILMRCLHQCLPLPLGAVYNQRSLVALENLIDLIITCCHHPAAANQIFLVSDGDDLSTTVLLQRTAEALAKPALLLPVPVSLIEFIAKLLGKQAVAQRLCGWLQLDISKTCQMLNWRPPVNTAEALRKTAQYYLRSR